MLKFIANWLSTISAALFVAAFLGTEHVYMSIFLGCFAIILGSIFQMLGGKK